MTATKRSCFIHGWYEGETCSQCQPQIPPAPVTPAPCTLTQFRAVLIRHCVVGYDAIADGEHYDGGRTLKATAAAFKEIRAMMGGQAV